MQLRKTFSAPLPSVRLNRMTGLVGQRMPYQLRRKCALMLNSLWDPEHMLYHMILPRAVYCWNDTQLM